MYKRQPHGLRSSEEWAEAARQGWLAYHIGRRSYHAAMDLVASSDEEARVREAFAAADTDGDGVLSAAELEAFASLAEWLHDPKDATNFPLNALARLTADRMREELQADHSEEVAPNPNDEDDEPGLGSSSSSFGLGATSCLLYTSPSPRD